MKESSFGALGGRRERGGGGGTVVGVGVEDDRGSDDEDGSEGVVDGAFPDGFVDGFAEAVAVIVESVTDPSAANVLASSLFFRNFFI